MNSAGSHLSIKRSGTVDDGLLLSTGFINSVTAEVNRKI